MINRRYPGTFPFGEDQDAQFFGRSIAEQHLYRMIKLHPLVVLHGKSGVGKSSLVNAGLIPNIYRDTKSSIEPIKVRFHRENSKDGTIISTLTPAQVTGNAIRKGKANIESYLDKLIKDESSLWHDAKEHQITSHHQTRRHRSTILLIFDQFEELFTYTDDDIIDFFQQISEVYYGEMPQRYWDRLDVLDQKVLTDDEYDLLYKKIKVKILIVIRNSRLHYLHPVSDYLPGILQNNYELKELSESEATNAIVVPASLKNSPIEFTCPPFKYSPELLDRILKYLTLDRSTTKIDATHLQIICNEIENDIISKKILFNESTNTLKNSNVGSLREIVNNYYRDRLKSIEDETSRFAAQRLIEDVLIYSPDQTRITVHQSIILNFFKGKNVTSPKELLKNLEKTGLIRHEVGVGGTYYELSHDRLIDIALEQKLLYEKRKRLEHEEELRKSISDQKKRFRKKILIYSVTSFILGLVIIQVGIQIKTYIDYIDKQGKVFESLEQDLYRNNEAILDDFIHDIDEDFSMLLYVQAQSKIEDALKIVHESNLLDKGDLFYRCLEQLFYLNQTSQKTSMDKILDLLCQKKCLFENEEQVAVMKQDFDLYLKEFQAGFRKKLYLKYYPLDLVEVRGGQFIQGMDSVYTYKINTFLSDLVASGKITKKDSLEKMAYKDIYLKSPTNVNMHSFYTSKHEITQRQYSLYLRANNKPSIAPPIHRSQRNLADLPANHVSWFDCIEYCNWVNKMLGLDSIYIKSVSKEYEIIDFQDWGTSIRLPLEQEWEYMAKGGPHFIKEKQFIFSGSDTCQNVSHIWNLMVRQDLVYPSEVGELKPNQLGIYDLSGNVAEWCFDEYRSSETNQIELHNNILIRHDRNKDINNSVRVLRGGSARTEFYMGTIDWRLSKNPTRYDENMGFRIVSTDKPEF